MNVEPHVKGVSFRGVVRAVETLHGAKGLDACFSSMDPALASAFRQGTFLASSWYPLDSYRKLLAAARIVAGASDRGVVDLGRQSTREDLTTIYRAVFKVLSPQSVFRLASRMFSNYYDTGACTIVDSGPGYAHAVWSGCTGFDHNMWLDVIGGAESFLDVAGARQIRIRFISGARDGEDRAEATANWT